MEGNEGMNKSLKLALPVAAMGLAGLGLAAPASAAGGSTTYTANLSTVKTNGGNGSGQLTLKLNGNQATVSEHVNGLAGKLPTDKKTLKSVGVPTAFAGKPFPHVQHVHVNGNDTCPTASADKNGDGVISTAEGRPAYGKIGTTLSTKGDTSPKAATDVTVAPGGGSFTYNRTFTMNQNTISAIKNNNAVIVVHGLNPANAPKGALTGANSLGVKLPGASKKLALIGTAPTLCGVLTQSQMSSMPHGAPNTGGGSTAGIEDGALLGLGGGLILAAGGAFAVRRRVGRKSS
jgi:hypothetical protein